MAATKKPSSTHPKATTAEIDKTYALLAEQHGHTIRKHFIGEALGINDERIIRDALAQIVLRSIVAVVPDRQHGGYKLTTDVGEIGAEIAHLDAYQRRINARVKALRKITRSLEGEVATTDAAEAA